MKIGEIAKVVKNVKDTRRQWGNIRHKLSDVLILALCSVMAGGVSFSEMENYSRREKEFFERFLDLPNGTPDADTFRRILQRIDPIEFQKYLCQAQDVMRGKWRTVNIDGKVMRGSGDEFQDPLNVVSAYVWEKQLTLGQMTVDKKSNEITAIPKLLDLIDIENDVVTIDAMGCQREIARKIVEKHADYILAVKGNQGDLHDAIKDYFHVTDLKPQFKSCEKSRGRIEKRDYTLCPDVSWLDNGKWANLKGIGRVRATTEHRGRKTVVDRFFITTLTDTKKFAQSVRSHWRIESMHWMLDVVFGEDKNRTRRGHAAKNLNILRKTALHLLSKIDIQVSYQSIRNKMFGIALAPEQLLVQLFE